MPSNTQNSSIEDKIRAASRQPEPRPEFLAALSTRLAGQPRPAQPPQGAEEPFRLSPGEWFAGLFRRPAWITAMVVLCVLVVSFLAAGPQRVIAALGNLFGYLPGIGVVVNGAGLSVLAEPVTITREGITLTVEQAAADHQHTVIVYRAEGLSVRAANSQGEGAVTGGPVQLVLLDGSTLDQTGGGGPGWGTGYEMKLTFPALPAGVSQATLVISRLQSMPPGAAPEDWRLPIQLKPAPEDLKVMPVYELATPQGIQTQTAQANAPTPSATTPSGVAAIPTSGPQPAAGTSDTTQNGIHFQLEKVIDLGTGFQLQGVVTWDDQSYNFVGVDPFDGFPYSLQDASGQDIPYEEAQADTSGISINRPYTPWAIITNSKAFPGPWKLTIAKMQVYQTIPAKQVSFSIDFGSNPQPGQSWTLNQDLSVGGKNVRVIAASLENNPREGNPVVNLIFETDPSITGVGVEDPQNQPDAAHPNAGAGGGGGGPAGAELPGRFSTSIPYYQMPSGIHQINITSVSYQIAGPWVVTWNPPAGEAQAAATPIAPACLTNSSWQKIKDQPLSGPPAGLSGRLLVEHNEGQLMPALSLINLDGSQRQDLATGGWSSLSPDGKTAAFIESNGPGLFLLDITTGQKNVVPGSTPEDYHPVFSPDSQSLAFVRSLAGIYIIRRDGSGLRLVADSTRVRSLAGWLPDGSGLVITSLSAEGSVVQTVDLQTGQISDRFTIRNAKGGFVQLSPDGKRVAYSEMTFGLASYGIYIANLDGSSKRQLAGLETGAAAANAWSPDGQWLALTIMESGPTGDIERTALVNVDSCLAWPVPGLQGQVTGWVELQ